ncbi:Protein MIZU-KUSSEI 1, partial [Dichanthelium oligosanthes]
AARGAVRVHHVERLRVAGADDALEARAHVHDVPLAAAARRRYDARAHGHGLQRAQHPPVRGAALAAHRVAAALAVAIRAPHLLLHQLLAAAAVGRGRGRGGARERAGGLGAVALERDADEAGRHLADQRRRGRGELEQHRGARARVHLEREVDVAAAVAVERACEPVSYTHLDVLVLVVGLRALGGAVLHAGRGVMAAALAKNRPLEVPPGEGEGGLVGAPRHDGPHGFFLRGRFVFPVVSTLKSAGGWGLCIL